MRPKAEEQVVRIPTMLRILCGWLNSASAAHEHRRKQNNWMLYFRLVNATLSWWIKPLWKRAASVEMVRRRFGQLDRLGSIGRRQAHVSHEQLMGIDVEWIRPTTAGISGTVVFLHGGAFCGRAPRADRRFCRRIAQLTGLSVLLLPYRLAPEHPFPSALEDCVRVVATLMRDGAEASGVVLVGHSAGANLALAALLRMRKQGHPLPAGAVLLSAPLDLTSSGSAATADHNGDVMADHALLPWVVKHYAASADVRNPEISPLLGDWRGLPMLSLHASTSEMLLGDAQRAVVKAQGADVAAELHLWPNLPHSYPFLDGTAEAEACRRKVGEFIRRALAGGGPLPCVESRA